MGWLAIQTTFVQNWLVQQVTSRLSKELNTTVEIKHVDFTLFNKMNMEGTLVKDLNKDTLLYAGKLNVNITDWFFLKDTIGIQYVGLEDAKIYLHRKDSIWNYKFLVEYFSVPPSGKKQKPIQLDIKKINFTRIAILQKDEWRGENLAFSIGSLKIGVNEFDLANKKIAINNIDLAEPVFSIYNYPGLRKKRPRNVNTNQPKQTTGLQWNPEDWKITANTLNITNGAFKNDVKMDRAPYYYFDGNHIIFSSINSHFTDIKFLKDTVSAVIDINTKERSGFTVNSLKANFKFHPKAMEFANLDIKTPKSRLRNYFAMRYYNFNDMSDFIEKIILDGNFKEAEIDSDDIAYFAPELANWKKHVQASGHVKGTITDLNGKHLLFKAGKNSVLDGDLEIKGLPDIDKTVITFNANEFKTTYADAVAIIPELKKVDELKSISYLRFKGKYSGLVRDFIAAGTIETNIGNITTDIHMQLPEKGAPSYSGKIITNDFDLGKFIDNSQLGVLSFNGNITGSGFNMKELKATLDGQVPKFNYNNYTYKNIKVNGKISNKLFNGKLNIDDEFIKTSLDGIVNLSKKIPEFNFTANIEKANLQKLHFTKQDIDISSKLNFNFAGNNIDNFLGTAKVYDASIFKNGERISFDSLTLSSSIIGKNKSIILQSNEIDAAIAGDFKILDLPAGFQTFLNRYYPSYIRPVNKPIKSQNFSFVIHTKKIDDYLDLINNDLKGFNNANVSGEINSKESVFNLNTEIPQFGYKHISYSGLKFEGKGNYDSLNIITNLEDIFVNDSLHFPGTKINITSANDISNVRFSTNANKTLDSALVQAQVQTLKNGVRILFSPSVFNINGNKWMIDKDGELILTKELVSSEGLRIHSNDQEVFITAHPSAISSSNDIDITLKKINIGDFTPFFVKTNRMEGLLNAKIDIIDPFGKLQVDVKGTAEQFRLDDDSIGIIDVGALYESKKGKVDFSAISKNEKYQFDLNGSFKNIDSVSAAQSLEINTNIQQTEIDLVQRYLTGIFSNLKGTATGNLKIVGSPKNLKYLGKIDLKDGGLLVDYTKCYYKIPSATLNFKDGEIDFGTFSIKDTLNNTGTVQNGILYHEGFDNMAFDFRLKTDKLLMLNTGPTDNNQFYGSVIGKATLSFFGPMDDMTMDIKGEPTDSSKLYLPMGSSRESGDADFIVWKVYGREMQALAKDGKESNLTVSMEMSANSYAKVYLIMDELTGDVIEATGRGNLKMRVGTKESMTLGGRYEIDEGVYLFSFQNWKKRFTIKKESGNSISWNGDPMQANLNIEAVYEAKNVKFSDLVSSNEAQFGQINDNVKKYRGDVLVIAKITESLTQPKIKFRIELPDNSAVRNEPGVTALLNLIERDENELNKQVSFLILFNSFGPLNTGKTSTAGTNIANTAFEGLVVNSISGLISNILTKEVSGVLQDVFNDKSLQVNINASLYNGASLINNNSSTTGSVQTILPDRTNLNFSVSKNFFNERLTFIVGSALDFGLSAQQNQAAFQFLPDVTAEYKLTPDGKFLLTFFYRNNYSYISNGPLSRSGASISYRREFDRLNEIFRKKKAKK